MFALPTPTASFSTINIGWNRKDINVNKIAKRVITAIEACESGKYNAEDLKIVNLIQSAPDLLKAAKNLLSRFVGKVEDYPCSKAIQALIDAVDSAEGN